MGRIGGAGDEEEITSAWASCRGLEAQGQASCSWEGPVEEGQGRKGSRVQGRCAATCFRCGWRFIQQQPLCGGLWEWSSPFMDFQPPEWVRMTVTIGGVAGAGSGPLLIPITQIDIGIGIICPVLYFFTCITFLLWKGNVVNV